MTTLTRRRLLGGIGAVAGVAGLTGLGLPARAAASKVNVGALRLVSHAPSFIAQERGYFAEAGLDVEFSFFQAAQPMAVAIASGDVGFGATAITGGLISLAQKGVAKVIGGALREEKGIPGQVILASNAAYEAGLTRPEALAGHSYGVTTAGSSFHYMGSRVARAAGVNPEELRFRPLQKVGAVIGALKSGQVDAWSIVPNIADGLVQAGAAKQIGLIADYIPDYQVTTLMCSAANAADEREKTAAFIAAFARGAADFNAALVDRSAGDADEIVAMIHKYVYEDDAPEVAARKIAAGAMRLSPGCALDMGSVEDQLDWFRAEGLVKDAVTTEMLVDPSYVDAA
ncbi:ABC transporter substrate-binding protein [Paroceanicella profunda]|uniref:ABC transporter substrate-binding protein n=1 Tax=Paroceanicella profunda TaxID=2579971 RepID=A0A5B8FX01_9RHOB|nr:ABC transporter substrate-binding protein [Paroceanicella profunda]QDL91710.1 ABC transporter substrate-binding protein [Paroceanicella profunda]